MKQPRHHLANSARWWADKLEHATDGCLLLCLFVAPLWFGGRHDLGRLLYAACVAGAVLAWSGRSWLLGEPFTRRSWAHAVVLAAIALVGAQLLPLGPELVGSLSPGLAELAPEWFPTADSAAEAPALTLGQWPCLSATPSATRVGMGVLVSHALLFIVVAERLRDGRALEGVLRNVALASIAMAGFALLQWLTSNGKLMWWYPHPQRVIGDSVQGSFGNKNHFAHFVVLGLAPAFFAMGAAKDRGSAAGPRKKSQTRLSAERLAWMISLVIATVAIVLSASRGGLLALLTAASVATVIGWRRGRLTTTRMAAGVLVVTAALMAISLIGAEGPLQRLEAITSGSANELDPEHGRREVWAANLAAARANPWFGYGVGSHADVYPAFIRRGFLTEFTHAESGYLQTLTETGLVGMLLLTAMLIVVGRWCVVGACAEQNPRRRAAWAAVSAGLAASAVHSLVDFVWYIPACMSMTVVLAACALRLHQTRPEGAPATAADPEARPLHGATGAAALCGCLSVALLWAPGRASIDWDSYLRASRLHRSHSAELARNPADAGAADDRRKAVQFLQQEMITALENVVRLHPGHARAHLRLAGRQLQQFETTRRGSANSIGLVQAREAALASNFSSREETDEWLRRAFGEDATRLASAHAHTLTGLRLAPLQGDGYCYLADLCFLSSPSQRGVSRLVERAVTMRPYDGGMLLEAGKQAWVAGRADQAVDYWKRAHRLPGPHRLQILSLLAGRVSAADYLETFRPESKTLQAMVAYYQTGSPNDQANLRAVSRYAGRLAEETPDARERLRIWLLASRAELALGNHAEAVRFARLASEDASSDYRVRRTLAECYVLGEEYEEARPHLRWCLSRQPQDGQLRRWLKATHLR